MSNLQKVATASESIEHESLQKLRAVFPEFVKENTIDFDALKAFFEKEGMLSGEKYGLSWAGKSRAFQAIRTPATGTLVPQREESKNWDNTENIFIEGDNLEVLKLLQKHYREKIKMIYIDPPYNTGKDFVYKDDFTQGVADYYEQTGQTQVGIKMSTNTEKNGRYHSDWLTMMYPRLFLAKNLLKEDGVIFVSIDDNEVANLRLIMDEIFGEENFIANIIRNTNSTKNQTKFVSVTFDYTLIYSKNKITLTNSLGEDNNWTVPKNNVTEYEKQVNSLLKKKIPIEQVTEELKELTNYPRFIDFTNYWYVDDRGVYMKDNLGGVENGNTVPIMNPVTGKLDEIPPGGFRYSSEKLNQLISENRIHFHSDGSLPRLKRYLSENLSQRPKGIMSDDQRPDYSLLSEFNTPFENPKQLHFIKRIVGIFENDSLILDFFAGSGTTAHAVMDLNAEDEGNRKWICVQLPEVTEQDSEAYKAGYKTIADISRERIRRAGEKIGKGDIGFKSFTLSNSNYRKWNEFTSEDDIEEVKKQSKLFLDKPLVDGYDEKSVVYEILEKEGFGLNAKVEQEKGNLKPWVATEDEIKLIVTFANKISKEDVEVLKLRESDIFVCFDNALDDTTKVNLGRNINIKTI